MITGRYNKASIAKKQFVKNHCDWLNLNIKLSKTCKQLQQGVSRLSSLVFLVRSLLQVIYLFLRFGTFFERCVSFTFLQVGVPAKEKCMNVNVQNTLFLLNTKMLSI